MSSTADYSTETTKNCCDKKCCRDTCADQGCCQCGESCQCPGNTGQGMCECRPDLSCSLDCCQTNCQGCCSIDQQVTEAKDQKDDYVYYSEEEDPQETEKQTRLALFNLNLEDLMGEILNPDPLQYGTELYLKVKKSTANYLTNGIHLTNLLAITEQVMKEVRKLKLAGFEKKALVLAIVRRLVQGTVGDMKNKLETTTTDANELGCQLHTELETLTTVINLALSPFIDQLYNLDPKKYGSRPGYRKFLCVG